MYKFYRVKQLRPNPNSVQARLPEVYNKYVKSLKLPQAPVHYVPELGKYRLDPETKEKQRVESREIPLSFPKEADEGIWGGEGVIKGFIQEKKKRRRFPNYWVPKLKQTVVYSEILNQHYDVTVTERALRLIDFHAGFDNYILGTPVQDLKSQLSRKIRRDMLLALVNKEEHHEDEGKNKEVFEKYKKYMIPKEEAEWFGLTLREAVQKQRILEAEQVPVPLKYELRRKFIEDLKGKDQIEDEEKEVTEESSWISRWNPFSRKKDDN